MTFKDWQSTSHWVGWPAAPEPGFEVDQYHEENIESRIKQGFDIQTYAPLLNADERFKPVLVDILTHSRTEPPAAETEKDDIVSLLQSDHRDAILDTVAAAVLARRGTYDHSEAAYPINLQAHLPLGFVKETPTALCAALCAIWRNFDQTLIHQKYPNWEQLRLIAIRMQCLLRRTIYLVAPCRFRTEFGLLSNVNYDIATVVEQAWRFSPYDLSQTVRVQSTESFDRCEELPMILLNCKDYSELTQFYDSESALRSPTRACFNQRVFALVLIASCLCQSDQKDMWSSGVICKYSILRCLHHLKNTVTKSEERIVDRWMEVLSILYEKNCAGFEKPTTVAWTAQINKTSAELREVFRGCAGYIDNCFSRPLCGCQTRYHECGDMSMDSSCNLPNSNPYILPSFL